VSIVAGSWPEKAPLCVVLLGVVVAALSIAAGEVSRAIPSRLLTGEGATGEVSARRRRMGESVDSVALNWKRDVL
jgi:hypothetical protein